MRPMSLWLAGLVLVLPLVAGAGESWPPGFVVARDVVPGLVEGIRYYGEDNFVGAPIDGYEAPVCILTAPAAKALAGVQERLEPFGLGLKVFDCYRPQRAVDHFVRWAADPDATEMQARYYPNVPKDVLFERGYIAEQSTHSRGSTVDVTLVDRATGEELDMGTGFDRFSPLSWPDAADATPQQRANRLLLRRLMAEAGFEPYAQEWWHFTLAREPFPETWFDFPVDHPPRD